MAYKYNYSSFSVTRKYVSTIKLIYKWAMKRYTISKEKLPYAWFSIERQEFRLQRGTWHQNT